MGTIVVGVDGSRESDRALRWAVDEARLRVATVQMVYAYEYTAAWSLYGYPTDGLIGDEMGAVPGAEMPAGEGASLEQEARARADGLLQQMAAGLEAHGVRLEMTAVHDRRPARALVQLSEDADLLVVGSRGRGGFTGVLLGSVSQHCVHHALCPVVIIPPSRQRGQPR